MVFHGFLDFFPLGAALFGPCVGVDPLGSLNLGPLDSYLLASRSLPRTPTWTYVDPFKALLQDVTQNRSWCDRLVMSLAALTRVFPKQSWFDKNSRNMSGEAPRQKVRKTIETQNRCFRPESKQSKTLGKQLKRNSKSVIRGRCERI